MSGFAPKTPPPERPTLRRAARPMPSGRVDLASRLLGAL